MINKACFNCCMNNQRGFVTSVLLTILGLVVLSFGAYMYIQNQEITVDDGEIQEMSQTMTNTDPSPVAHTMPTQTASSTVSVPGMSKYTDTEFGFSFWYPSGWKVVREDVPTTSADSEWDAKHIHVGDRMTLIVRRPMPDGSFFVEPNAVLVSVAQYGMTMGNLASYDMSSALSKNYRIFSVLLNPQIDIFVGWDTAQGSSDFDPRPLLKTIVATNVITGVDNPAEQTKVIQAEKAAYISTSISPAQAVSLLYASPKVKRGYSANASSLYCGDHDYTEDDQYYYFLCSVLMAEGYRVNVGKFSVDKYTGSVQ